MPQPSILFFDGVCNLCNRWVDFVIRRDKKKRFYFAPLQGQTAAAKLSEADRTALASVVLLEAGKTYRHSEAALRVLQGLGGAWGLAGTIGLLVPRVVRDWVYRLVARNRYFWFGTRETCRLPEPHERERFLD